MNTEQTWVDLTEQARRLLMTETMVFGLKAYSMLLESERTSHLFSQITCNFDTRLSSFRLTFHARISKLQSKIISSQEFQMPERQTNYKLLLKVN
jgi:hypothetical protein